MAYDGDELLDSVTSKEYEFGFVTDIESDKAPIGLNEDIIRLISSKKGEPGWLLQWRLEASWLLLCLFHWNQHSFVVVVVVVVFLLEGHRGSVGRCTDRANHIVVSMDLFE